MTKIQELEETLENRPDQAQYLIPALQEVQTRYRYLPEEALRVGRHHTGNGEMGVRSFAGRNVARTQASVRHATDRLTERLGQIGEAGKPFEGTRDEGSPHLSVASPRGRKEMRRVL
jgi:hypothetical protein